MPTTDIKTTAPPETWAGLVPTSGTEAMWQHRTQREEELRHLIRDVLLTDVHDTSEEMQGLLDMAREVVRDERLLADPMFVMGYAFALASLVEYRNRLLQDDAIETCALENMARNKVVVSMLEPPGATIEDIRRHTGLATDVILRECAMLMALRAARRTIVNMEVRVQLTEFGQRLAREIEGRLDDAYERPA